MASRCPSRVGHRACLPCLLLRSPAPVFQPSSAGDGWSHSGVLLTEDKTILDSLANWHKPACPWLREGEEEQKRERLEHLAELVNYLHEGGRFRLTAEDSGSFDNAPSLWRCPVHKSHSATGHLVIARGYILA